MNAYVFGLAGPPSPRRPPSPPGGRDPEEAPGGRGGTWREFALVLCLSLLVVAVPTALAVLSNRVFPHEREIPPVEQPVLELRGDPGG